MKRLITLGCSLTHQIGWADHVAEKLRLPLLNLAVSSGSNHIQVSAMKRMILKDEIDPSDLIIWQITSVERPPADAKFTLLNESMCKKEPKGSYSISNDVNLFDNLKRIHFLSHTAQARSSYKQKWVNDLEQRMEDLLFVLRSTKNVSPNLLVVFGWNEIFPKGTFKIFKEYLNKFNIKYIDETIVDWCRDKGLDFNGEDKTHPSHSSYQIYADTFILPKIKQGLF